MGTQIDKNKQDGGYRWEEVVEVVEDSGNFEAVLMVSRTFEVLTLTSISFITSV
jgi:hypothetical protein